MKIKLLLAAVFGPYGIKTKYAEALGMQMELLNNQITREQGVHSPRQSYWTFPLYLLAENIQVETTVLDFPSWNDFTEELGKGYTHVGINFIVPNVLKAQRMARHIRKHHPEITIILGGYGAAIPDVREMVPADDICTGEGVRWLREYFGEDPDRPLKHPLIHGPAYEYLYGARGTPKGAILMTGVGCDNACRFCATSHQFGKKYLPLFSTGEEIFRTCCDTEAALGSRGFTILDENFLKKPERAKELLDLMTKNNKPFVFDIFSSAEVITKMGVDFLLRLGVRMIWIGVESKYNSHDKLKNINIRELIRLLQSKGIVVNASTILFQDHHDEKTIREDIDFAIGLGSDFIQFMNYTPLPGTAFYREMQEEKRLKDLPLRYVHGAGELFFIHPHFNDRKDHAAYLRMAFRKKYLHDGPGVVSMAKTALQGYIRARDEHRNRQMNGIAWDSGECRYVSCEGGHEDRFMELRIKMMRKITVNIRPILLAAWAFSPNRKSRKKVLEIARSYREVFGPMDIKQRAVSIVLVLTGAIEQVKIMASRMRGRECVVYQPPCKKTSYPCRQDDYGEREACREQPCCSGSLL